MSFVGPRPEDPYFVRLYTPAQREVLRVRPGVVGPSQILGRDELELYPEGVDTEQYYIHHILPQKLQTDLEYVRRARLWYDLKLLGHGLAVTILGTIKPKYFRFSGEKISFLALDTALSLLDLLDGLRPQVRLGPEAGCALVPGDGLGPDRAHPAVLLRVLRPLPEHPALPGDERVRGRPQGRDAWAAC